MEVVAGAAGLASGQIRRGCASVACTRRWQAGIIGLLRGSPVPRPRLHREPRYWEGSKPLLNVTACHSGQGPGERGGARGQRGFVGAE